MDMYSYIVLILIFFAIHSHTYKVLVRVKQGIIRGTKAITVFKEKHYFAFYGVPYALPPTGKLRFKDPKPDVQWQKQFDASTEYHGACSQPHIVHNKAVYGFEDCLNLNIYTPSLPRSENEKLKPVMVWVHGYAFTSSLSHIQGADFLIDNDVLFVTVTHRLGAFGFLKQNSSIPHGNMGLKDIVMALKWIRKNIKKFGGDRNKITAMGSGSGATYLSLLLMTKYKALFSKIILQSGSIFSPFNFFANPGLEKSKLETALKSKGIKSIKKATAKEIVISSQKLYSSKQKINHQRPLNPFLPTIENIGKKSLLTQTPDVFFSNLKKDYNIYNIPILIGFNSQESISENLLFINNPKYLKALNDFLRYMVPFSDGCSYNYTSEEYRTVNDIIMRRYFKNGISESSLSQFLRYTTDLIKYPILKFIKTHLKIFTSPLFVYKFDYIGQMNTVKATVMANTKSKVTGASCGDEICYIMKCEPVGESYARLKNDTNNRDKRFIERISEMWANFAKFGDPTPIAHRGEPKWLPMTSKDNNLYYLGKENKLIDSKKEDNMFKFWNELYDKYYTPEICSKNKNGHHEL